MLLHKIPASPGTNKRPAEAMPKADGNQFCLRFCLCLRR